jgi:hypothetical protein
VRAHFRNASLHTPSSRCHYGGTSPAVGLTVGLTDCSSLLLRCAGERAQTPIPFLQPADPGAEGERAGAGSRALEDPHSYLSPDSSDSSESSHDEREVTWSAPLLNRTGQASISESEDEGVFDSFSLSVSRAGAAAVRRSLLGGRLAD